MLARKLLASSNSRSEYRLLTSFERLPKADKLRARFLHTSADRRFSSVVRGRQRATRPTGDAAIGVLKPAKFRHGFRWASAALAWSAGGDLGQPNRRPSPSAGLSAGLSGALSGLRRRPSKRREWGRWPGRRGLTRGAAVTQGRVRRPLVTCSSASAIVGVAVRRASSLFSAQFCCCSATMS
jgi:hypothetical protein